MGIIDTRHLEEGTLNNKETEDALRPIVNEETEPVLSDELLATIQINERWREITPLFALLRLPKKDHF